MNDPEMQAQWDSEDAHDNLMRDAMDEGIVRLIDLADPAVIADLTEMVRLTREAQEVARKAADLLDKAAEKAREIKTACELAGEERFEDMLTYQQMRSHNVTALAMDALIEMADYVEGAAGSLEGLELADKLRPAVGRL